MTVSVLAVAYMWLCSDSRRYPVDIYLHRHALFQFDRRARDNNHSISTSPLSYDHARHHQLPSPSVLLMLPSSSRSMHTRLYGASKARVSRMLAEETRGRGTGNRNIRCAINVLPLFYVIGQYECDASFFTAVLYGPRTHCV